MRIAVLGLGVIGRSWALAFLGEGLEVHAWDPDECARMTLAADARASGLEAKIFTDAAEAVDGADFVQESAPERSSIKHALMHSIGAKSPRDAIFASSTSTITASALQQGCAFAERVLVGHPFNPPHIIPLVEVVAGKQTSEKAVALAMELYRSIGKHPIQLRTERPGHLANRLQAALWREAIDAVASGQASVADVDAVVTHALGPRWCLNGPFATFDLAGGEGGLAHFLEHLGPQLEKLWDDAQRPIVTRKLSVRLVTENSQRFANENYRRRIAKRDAVLHQILEVIDSA
jgi:3-hydroxyacyl-CoA dehydrogenase